MAPAGDNSENIDIFRRENEKVAVEVLARGIENSELRIIIKARNYESPNEAINEAKEETIQVQESRVMHFNQRDCQNRHSAARAYHQNRRFGENLQQRHQNNWRSINYRNSRRFFCNNNFNNKCRGRSFQNQNYANRQQNSPNQNVHTQNYDNRQQNQMRSSNHIYTVNPLQTAQNT